ncbi:MAG TPA: hypothetical protein VGX25_04005 [Actinophytocola sp.]|uniref:hypothetical protein n=1 Tax=Actinophytocola sp. TaxID=1872138 RepID=UPI002DDCC393|nr:hypothetical protein [Actinophytocola sp.]HEV2778542.1 hypothetical protein [Actinophytocola sp.]
MATRDLIFTILGIDRASPTFDKVGRSVDQTAKKLDSFGKTSTAALVGTVGAAAAAGAGIAAALGGTALLVGGLGVAAAASNTAVSDSFTDLWHNIQTGTRESAQVLVPGLVGISDQLADTFDEVQPRLVGMFADTMPGLQHLTDGFTGFIRETMPGLEKAVASSEPVLEAVRDVAIDTGKGVTDFFTGVSSGSESSAQILRVFGGIARDVLGFTGDLLARLANEGAPSVQRLGEVISQLLGVITQLSAGALPVLFQAAGAGLNVFSGLLTMIGGSSAQLGPLIGLVISAGVAFKALDVITFGGLSAQFGRLKAEIGAAHTVGGKLRAGLGGLLTGIGPLGVAAGGLGVMLGVLGARQQEAAQRAAEHRARIESLTDALVASGGVINDNIAQGQVKAAQDAGLYEVVGRLGVSSRTLTEALLGNKSAIGEVNAGFDRFGITMGGTNHVFAESLDRFKGMKGQDSLGGLARVAVEAKGKFGELSGGMLEAKDAAGEIATKHHEAASATDRHTAAMARLQEQLLGFVNKDLAYRQAVNAEREAVDQAAEAVRKKAEADTAVTETVRQYGEKSAEAAAAVEKQKEAAEAVTGANLGWEQSMVNTVARAGELAESQYRGSDAAEAARLRVDAQNREIIRLAELAGDAAPPALRQMILGMDASTRAALGVTSTVNAAGQAVLRLPNGKEIVLTAADQATPVVRNIKTSMDLIKDKTVTVTVRQAILKEARYGGLEPSERAEGGPVKANLPYWVGERGPELIFPDRDGFVATAAQSRAIAGGRVGSAVAAAGGATVVLNVYAPIGSQLELQNWLARGVDELKRQGRV